ncbi:MAG: glycosyltransferase [Alphaproteobacteria bacterium]|nr:glycosyltransferase [Alphaproteobacteria bacterium]
MKIAVIDPSLFTIPYDEALCGALTERGGRPTLFGRALRGGEMRAGQTPLEPVFYRLVERCHKALPPRLFRLAKGIEHGADMLRLARRLGADPPDIIHFQWAPLPVLDQHVIPRLRRLAPVLLTVHDTTPFNGSPNDALQAVGAASIFATFDHLIVHSEGGRSQLAARGLPRERISVIPHGTLSLPSAASPGDASAPSDGPGDGPSHGMCTILAFGKIKPYKGIDLLIEAFAQLPPQLRSRARLRIVGEPYMPLDPLKLRARELGIAHRVEWHERYVRDDEIGGIIGAADILAFPYRQIDASGVLMASLGYGKPIVASAIGAFADLLRDGEHGRLVPPEDVTALSLALADLVGDPARAQAMGERTRGIAAGIAGWPEIAEKTLSLYQRLIAERAQFRPYVSSKRTMSSSPR